MENFTINHICGHTQVKPISEVSPSDCRTECPVCREKAQKEFFKNIKIADLVGSEKQIAWATKIRKSFCNNRKSNSKHAQEEIYVLENITESRIWIEKRVDFEKGKLPAAVRCNATKSSKNKQ